MITFSEREFNGATLPVMYDEKPVALIAIDARGLDFLIEQLHDGDAFADDLRTLREQLRDGDAFADDLRTLRERATEALWEREAS